MHFNINTFESNSLRLICNRRDEITINNKTIRFLNRINGVAVSQTSIYILLYECDESGDIPGAVQPLNNIDAYDYEGNLQWNISEIIGDVPNPFIFIEIHTKKTILERLENKGWGFDSEHVIDGHEFLFCSDIGGLYYVIDITDKKLIYRKGFRS